MTFKSAFLCCIALTIVLSGATVGALSYYLDPKADTLAGATQLPRIARYQKEALAPQSAARSAQPEAAPAAALSASVVFASEEPRGLSIAPEAPRVTPVVAAQISEVTPSETVEAKSPQRERPRQKRDSWANLR